MTATARSNRLVALALLVAALTIATVTATVVPASADSPNPPVFPPNSHPYGKSYGEWGAEWNTWLHRISPAVSPMFDATGENCDEGQSGPVWFLMGIPGGTGSRQCTVPHGKSIFVPLQNSFWWNWTTDPPGPHSPEFEAFVRSLLAPALEDHGLYASIDGVEVTDPTSYGNESPVFYSWVPDDNIIDYLATEWGGYSDWKEGMSGPHYDAGVYVMVKPLTRGNHEISLSGWDGAWAGTWHITVE